MRALARGFRLRFLLSEPFDSSAMSVAGAATATVVLAVVRPPDFVVFRAPLAALAGAEGSVFVTPARGRRFGFSAAGGVTSAVPTAVGATGNKPAILSVPASTSATSMSPRDVARALLIRYSTSAQILQNKSSAAVPAACGRPASRSSGPSAAVFDRNMFLSRIRDVNLDSIVRQASFSRSSCASRSAICSLPTSLRRSNIHGRLYHAARLADADRRREHYHDHFGLAGQASSVTAVERRDASGHRSDVDGRYRAISLQRRPEQLRASA